MDYEWDLQKAATNRRKHGVDFSDAVGVFEDEQAITIEDEDAEGEQVFITLGLDFSQRHLVVVYAYRHRGSIRIISARKATKKERAAYEKRI